MHLLSARPGGHVEDGGQGIVRVNQTPGDIVVLSAADTVLALLADAAGQLATGHPTVRLANLMWLRQPASVDLYVDDVLRHARVVVIDHLGSPSDWAYVVERASSLARERGQWLAMFSGDFTEDPQLLLRSTAPAEECRHLWRCLREGGASNGAAFFSLIAHAAFGLGPRPPAPTPLPVAMRYEPRDLPAPPWKAGAPVALLVFYRAHLQAGNTAVFDAVLQALWRIGVNALALAVDSLKNPACQELIRSLAAQHAVDVVLNATHFAVASLHDDLGDSVLAGAESHGIAGDAPVLQLITAGCSQEQWQDDPHGLAPRDLAMQVVLPEVDGRIVTRAISFKGLARRCERTELDVVRYQPEPERIAFVAELARRWAALRHRPNGDKRVALILANYPTDDSRLANGVGLDTPASTVAILRALREAGYATGDSPADGGALIAALTRGVTNDAQANELRPAWQSMALADYLAEFERLPTGSRTALEARWGPPEQDPMLRSGRFMIPGLRLGHVFVGIQPARDRAPVGWGAAKGNPNDVGWGAAQRNPSPEPDLLASYHDSELVPPHHYLAFYFWLRTQFQVDAIVHAGKHGNLEWLPGKSVALGAACWPDALLGPLPHLYPFIVNDPGEGSQAKRRTQAVIIDHLMPAATRAESYGPLQKLERQMDEYYEALSLDPRRARRLRESILDQVLQEKLHHELACAPPADEASREALLSRLDAYLCEIKDSQIRDGLHIFGSSPQGRQRVATLVALARYDRGSRPGERSLLAALAQDLALDADGFHVFESDPAQPWRGARPAILVQLAGSPWRHAGHTRERLELLATRLVEKALGAGGLPPGFDALWPQTAPVLSSVRDTLAPRLDACGALELAHFLRGLAGRFVPPGPSGSPSRGRPDVLPTGRNFYSVDTRCVPTPTAYAMGAAAAERLVERHLQDHGEMLRQVGLSVWGTSTMRTGGEDLGQAFALLGVRPKWAAGSGRVVDIEVLPMNIRNRPRVDVTLRVSGFLRDAFPNVIDLFDTAVRAVAAISEEDEPDDVNPIRGSVQRERGQAVAAGLSAEDALRQATWRVFGPRPGAYGSGVQEALTSGRWQDHRDLAEAYLHAGGFAYGQDGHGIPARRAFEQRLGQLDAVAHNQDNREHDLLDSADYALFQGGMATAVRSLAGAEPALYHGDFSVPGAPRIRSLQEEVARVVRARAVNPKWLEGVRRHGYKGAVEIAATVDNLFAFGATTGVVGDHQYELVADAYLHDDATREFLQQHNPQALRGLGERLLEAIHRGLWQDAGEHRERIAQHLLALERRLEDNEP